MQMLLILMWCIAFPFFSFFFYLLLKIKLKWKYKNIYELIVYIKDAQNLSIFKSNLKTHFFRLAFSQWF